MAANIITLRISGTKVRKAGFSPLVAIGILPPAEEHNLDRSLQVAERPGFIIKQTPDYVLYNAVDCKVRPVDDDAPGRMSVALSIPANMQLAGGASPYNLLMEVYTFFRNNYMSPLSDGRDVFINTEVDAEQFRSILGRYSLEERKNRYVTMNPSGVSGRVRLGESKMADFFRDSQYPEFGQFKEIEVGTTGESSPALDALQVPRPKAYKLKINGIEKATVSNPAEPLPVRAQSTATEEYTPVTFTINELIENGGMLKRDGATIMLDPATETISCDLERKQISFRVRVNWTVNKDSADMMKQWMENGEITIRQNNKDYTRELIDGNCRISARNARDQFRASSEKYRGHIISINQTVDLDKREVVLTFNVTQERRTYTPGANPRQGGNGGNAGNRNVVGNNGNSQIGKTVMNDVTPQQPVKDTKGEQQRAFFFGILIGFILGLAAFYALNEFVLKDKQAETDQMAQSITQPDPVVADAPVAEDTPTTGEVTPVPAPTPETPEPVKQEKEKNVTPPTPTAQETIASKPTTPSLDALKKELVKNYNANSWKKCLGVIGQNKDLEVYKADLEYIMRIRQNKLFDSKGGFKSPEITESQVAMLKSAGYIDDANKPTNAFKIDNVDDITKKRKAIESLMSDF